MPWKAAQQACTYVAKRPGGRSSSIPTGRCGRWLRACWAGVGRHSRSRGHSSACGPKTANYTSRTRRSTTPSTRTPRANCARLCWHACAKAAAPAGRALRGRTDAARFPRWSASTCARPRSQTGSCLATGNGDLIKGASNKSSVGLLVERTTPLVLLARMPDATAESALAGLAAKLHQIVAPLHQTLTYDQGHEMARPRELSRNTNMRVYFCNPYSP